MIKSKILFADIVIGLFLLTGCGIDPSNDDTPTSVLNLAAITDLNLEIVDVNKSTNIAQVHITSKVENALTFDIYDNNNLTPLQSGTVEDGYLSVSSGVHNVQVCANDKEEKVCSDVIPLLISENLDLASYKKVATVDESRALTNDGKNLIYGTVNGELYSLDLTTEESIFLYNVQIIISGLAYDYEGSYYYSSTETDKMSHLDINNTLDQKLASIPFPDGLDLYNGEIYTVENDLSGTVLVLDKNGTTQRRLSTGISDITGITHTNKYLYILSEDGEIFQTNSLTGVSNKIFTNDNFFSAGNATTGLEAITILNNKFYVVYVDDKSIYRIDINIEEYE